MKYEITANSFFIPLEGFLWWDVVIAISYAVKVKTFWRNNI